MSARTVLLYYASCLGRWIWADRLSTDLHRSVVYLMLYVDRVKLIWGACYLSLSQFSLSGWLRARRQC